MARYNELSIGVMHHGLPDETVNYVGRGTAAPTSGDWEQGDVIYNSAPTAGGTIGWVCTTAGSPGTWKTFGTIAA